MSKRGRKKKVKVNFNLQRETVISVLAILLILLSFLTLVSFFAPNYALNRIIQKVLKLGFGYASIIIPFILGLFGLLFIEKIQAKIKEGRIVLGLFILLLSLSAFLHLFIKADESLSIAKSGGGGGYFGHFTSSTLKNTVSLLGAIPVVFAGFISSVLLIFDLTLSKLLSFVNIPSVNLKSISFGNKNKSINDLDNADVVSDILDKDFDFNFENSTNNEQDNEIKDIQTKIEIIPTMSEPQKAQVVSMQKSSDDKSLVTTPLGINKIWNTPPLELLVEPINDNIDVGNAKERAKIIKDKLRIQGIGSEIVDVKVGPTVTQYELKPNSDVKIARILNMEKDLAAALASSSGSVRIQAPIPGTPHVGIEVPNIKRATVYFKSLVSSGPMRSLKSKLGIVLGKDVSGQTFTYDIGKMPHLLVAGATGSGKSIFIHNIMFSILFRSSPQEVKFILVDPKRVELGLYNGIPHLLTPVVTDMEKAPSVFKWAVAEMDKRLKKFEDAKVQNIDAYNEKAGFQSMPYIVIIVDEFADIMLQDPSGVEKSIVRLAQVARATGIHLILALQRPTTNVITGLIKANIPARAAFKVASNMDSRVIIDQPGAEKLLGKGDMLFMASDIGKPIRLQGAFVSPSEIEKLTDYLREQGVEPDFKEEVLTMGNSGSSNTSNAGYDDVDELFDECADIVISAKKASSSMLQTKLSIGYARASRILQQLEDKGIVGPAQGSKPRDVLVDSVPMSNDSNNGQDELVSLG